MCRRGLRLELDLPLTGIMDLEDRVGLPAFDTPFCERDHVANQASHFEAHFASQIALRRLCANLHNDINECELRFLLLPRHEQSSGMRCPLCVPELFLYGAVPGHPVPKYPCWKGGRTSDPLADTPQQ